MNFEEALDLILESTKQIFRGDPAIKWPNEFNGGDLTVPQIVEVSLLAIRRHLLGMEHRRFQLPLTGSAGTFDSIGHCLDDLSKRQGEVVEEVLQLKDEGTTEEALARLAFEVIVRKLESVALREQVLRADGMGAAALEPAAAYYREKHDYNLPAEGP